MHEFNYAIVLRTLLYPRYQQMYVGKGWVVQEVGVGCNGAGVGLGGWWVRVEGGLGVGTGGVGERSAGARVWTHSATSVTEDV